MPQSNFIFGALFIAFVVFITTRGSLPFYMKALFGGGGSSSASGPNPEAQAFGSGLDAAGRAAADAMAKGMGF